MNDTILYYKTKDKNSYVVANEHNIHERIKYAENNENFVEWSQDSEFYINLLINANKKIK